MVGMNTGPAKLQKVAPQTQQWVKVIFRFGIEPPRLCPPRTRHHPIGPDHMVKPGRIPAVVDQDQVIAKGIKAVALQPGGMIDIGPIPAQFRHEDRISQPLRPKQILCRLGKSHGIRRVFGVHRRRSGPQGRPDLATTLGHCNSPLRP